MQPPPRKGNYAKFLKTLHSEQVAKLQLKHQHEIDLLEDIRNFTLKRSAIEKSYSEALLKISSAFLNKKIPNIPDIKTPGGEEKWNMWNVWRTVLEENEKLARARLAAVEVFHQQVADDAKVLRAQKVHVSKKSVDQLTVIQKELQTCVQEVDKTKKFYFDEEHSAHDVRDKAKDIEEKLKKKKGSFFQSITSLQKNSARVSSKRDALEEKSTGARNDYLLSLASANAHQTRYFVIDLQSTITTMENQVFEKVAEYLTLIGRTELLTCSATQHSFGRIRDQAQQLTREYNLQCLYLYYPVLKQHIQYDFEPCENDLVDKITADIPSAVVVLSKEARRYATRISRENNNIRECFRKLQNYHQLRDSGQRIDPADQNGPDLETKIEDMRLSIRKSETAKSKAEARIECLRAGGVNVDEWMQEVDNLSVQDMARSTSSLSVRTDASGAGEQPSSDSFYDSDYEGGGPETARGGSAGGDSGGGGETEFAFALVNNDAREDAKMRADAAEVDAMLERERQRIEQLTAGWDDPTQDNWGAADDKDEAEDVEGVEATVSRVAPVGDGVVTYKCVAVYNYTAQNPDELSIVENEQLEVVGEGDGDGWLRARNYRGEEGYVPHNYLDVDPGGATVAAAEATTFQVTSQISFSSVDYTVDEQDESPIAQQPASALKSPPAAQSPPAAVAVAQPSHKQAPPPLEDVKLPLKPQKQHSNADNGCWCIAMYDYDATCPDELTFVEGQVLKILRKVVHDDVDDGWWEGELDNVVGLFPSLVVEECRADGEPLTPEDDEDGPTSAPPVFTPPDVPSFLLAPQQVIITSATPCTDADDDDAKEAAVEQPKPSTAPTASTSSQGFAMEMTKGQRKHYRKQFDGEGDDDDDPERNGTMQAAGSGVPSFAMVVDDGDDPQASASSDFKPPTKKAPPPSADSFGLGVASIVITCATPMVEEPEEPFPPPPEEEEEVPEDPLPEEEVPDEPLGIPEMIPEEPEDPPDDQPTDSAPFPISSSTGSEEDTYTGPSTAENSQSQPPPAPQEDADLHKQGSKKERADGRGAASAAGQRGSIPDELEPHQLAKLQDLKESNA